MKIIFIRSTATSEFTLAKKSLLCQSTGMKLDFILDTKEGQISADCSMSGKMNIFCFRRKLLN